MTLGFSSRCHSLDDKALPIMQLKGEEPVESIDLSGRELGICSAIVIAELIASNTTTKSLKYAAPFEILCRCCRQPMMCPSTLLGSLGNNWLQGAGANYVANTLTFHQTLTTVRYTPTLLISPPDIVISTSAPSNPWV